MVSLSKHILYLMLFLLEMIQIKFRIKLSQNGFQVGYKQFIEKFQFAVPKLHF